MKTTDLFLRCYAEKQDDLWVAVCIDLSLAAQSEDFREAIQKLNHQIIDYVKEAYSEPEFTEQLLTRRNAPLSQRLKYYACVLKVKICHFLLRTVMAAQNNSSCSPSEKPDVKIFQQPLPMAPAF